MIRLSRSPFGFTFRKLGVSQFYVKCTGDGVDLDDVAVPQKPDRPANGSLWPNMTDAEPAGCAGKPAICDERDLAARPLPGQRRRGRQHFPHSGTAARPLIADHDHFAVLVGSLLDGLEGIL